MRSEVNIKEQQGLEQSDLSTVRWMPEMLRCIMLIVSFALRMLFQQVANKRMRAFMNMSAMLQ
jgi:hypothetical protein